MKSNFTLIATFLIITSISCKKENNTFQSSSITEKDSAPNLVTGITDRYSYVKIGSQNWMTRNLDVNHYRNGDTIPQVQDDAAWFALKTGAWCWYGNRIANGKVYGKLYNWYAVNDPRGLAPTGWHVPSRDEWNRLCYFLGRPYAGAKLKDTGTIEAGTGLWHSPNTGATNETGFTGLPGGSRSGGSFTTIRYDGFWWSSTQYDRDHRASYYSGLSFYYQNYALYYDYTNAGLSVRCIKD